MQNLEIKCIYPAHRLAERLAVGEVGALNFGRLKQTDTYFHVSRGRLKLRHSLHYAPQRDARPAGCYELISYRRLDLGAARPSFYEILAIPDGPKTLRFLSACLGVKVRVYKSRKVYLRENLRIHLDTVRGLGRFLEFELLVSRSHPLATCKKQMSQLLALFHVSKESLIRFSYSDLLLRGPRDQSP
jgi:adenylate cyclase class IV